jgi:hypothetical protein
VRAIIAKCCQRRSFEIPSAVSPFTRKLPPTANADPAISAPPQLGEYTYASTMSDDTHLSFPRSVARKLEASILRFRYVTDFLGKAKQGWRRRKNPSFSFSDHLGFSPFSSPFRCLFCEFASDQSSPLHGYF